MRKALLIPALFLFLLFSSTPSQTIAQVQSNTFNCTWTGIECVVDIATEDCVPGYQRVESVCNNLTDLSSCQGSINNPCQENIPPGLCYACVNASCTLVDPNNYGACPYPGTPQGLSSCNTGCSQPINNFRCDNNSCVADPNGPYTSSTECEAQCALGGGGGASTNVALCDDSHIDTAIGCIPFDSESNFIGFILSWAIGIGGGVAFIMMLFAGFQIMTSAGNPDRLRAGQELLTSAIAGLILLVFSVFILRVIGIDILGISSLGQ